MSILEKIAKEAPKTIQSNSNNKDSPPPSRTSTANNNNNNSRITKSATPSSRSTAAPAKGTSKKAADDAALTKAADERSFAIMKSKYKNIKKKKERPNAAPKMSAGKRFSQRLTPAQRTYFNKLYKSDRTKFRSELARFNRSKGKFSMGQIAAQPASKMSGSQMVNTYYSRPGRSTMSGAQMVQRYYSRPDFTPMTKPQTTKPAPAATGEQEGYLNSVYKYLASLVGG